VGDTRVLLADPPWSFKDRLPGKGRGADKHYRTLSAADIMRFPLPTLAKDCWLFLWRVHTHQEEAKLVMRAWGFTYASEFVWVKLAKSGKVRIGMGHTLRQSHEVCLVGRRGKPARLSKGVGSVILAPRSEHSAKPPEAYELIERFAPGPYHELFARNFRKGWTSSGDQLGARNG
jgi:N6-adenosine-specific RNA methylase IME4